MNCILLNLLEEFIRSLIKPFMGNVSNQSLDFIVKIIPKRRVGRTVKKKVNFVVY